MRLFLTEDGYQAALQSQQCREIKIKRYARVIEGHILDFKPGKTPPLINPWKKELVYRDVKQGSNEIKFVKPWVLPPVLYIHNRAWRKVYQLGKIFLCPPFCFPSFFYRYT